MKRILALLLTLLLASLPVLAESGGSGSHYPVPFDAAAPGAGTAEPAEPAEPAEAAEPAESAAGRRTIQQVRYYFEQDLLPRYFYDMPQNMIDVLREHGVYALWESFVVENGYDPFYPAEECAERLFTAEGGAQVLQVLLPAPDYNLLCYRIYFVYDPGTGSAGYYTVESDTFTPETAFICMRTQEQVHMNFGGVDVLDPQSPDLEAALQREAEQIAGQAGIAGALSLSVAD